MSRRREVLGGVEAPCRFLAIVKAPEPKRALHPEPGRAKRHVGKSRVRGEAKTVLRAFRVESKSPIFVMGGVVVTPRKQGSHLEPRARGTARQPERDQRLARLAEREDLLLDERAVLGRK